jgi:hypothetical protein
VVFTIEILSFTGNSFLLNCPYILFHTFRKINYLTIKETEMETLLIISHEVKNFDTWKTAFEAGEPMRTQAGVKVKGVYRSSEKADMEKAGVISTPEIKILASVN